MGSTGGDDLRRCDEIDLRGRGEGDACGRSGDLKEDDVGEAAARRGIGNGDGDCGGRSDVRGRNGCGELSGADKGGGAGGTVPVGGSAGDEAGTVEGESEGGPAGNGGRRAERLVEERNGIVGSENGRGG